VLIHTSVTTGSITSGIAAGRERVSVDADHDRAVLEERRGVDPAALASIATARE
jgi:hypothetical protein